MIVETAVVPKMTSHRFPIQNGRVRETMKEFMAFKERYYSCWGAITVILRRMEEMLVNFNVPIAFVDGDKLAQVGGLSLMSKKQKQNKTKNQQENQTMYTESSNHLYFFLFLTDVSMGLGRLFQAL